MTERTIGWGIAGTGFVARVFAEGLAGVSGGRLAAVASRDLGRAQAFARVYGAARAHGSYAALASDPDVQIVYVGTPHSDHHATSTIMLEGGKALLCEKPFALDAAETRAIIALARDKRLFCMEAMWMRFMPAVTELSRLVNAGEIGEPRSASIELGHALRVDPEHRLFAPALGGGALLDLGVYAVSLALLLFGPATNVQSQMTVGPSGVDEHVTALLGHAGARHSYIAASLRTRLSNGASIAGTQGWARLHEPLYRPSAITLVAAPPQAFPSVDIEAIAAAPRRRAASFHRALGRAGRMLSAAAPGLFARAAGRTIRRPYEGNGYGYEAAEAMRCLKAGLLESPKMPLGESIRVMETLDAIRAAWKVL